MSNLKRIALLYAAASMGGLTVPLTAWLLGTLGVADLFGVAIKPPLTPDALYRPMVWGGLWGLIFLLPLRISPLWLKGLVMTLFPVAAAFVYFIPARGGAMFALDRGSLAPLYIYIFNAPWGLVTAYLARALGALKA